MENGSVLVYRGKIFQYFFHNIIPRSKLINGRETVTLFIHKIQYKFPNV